MKKLLFPALLCAALFASCSGDDSEGSSVTESELLGKWYYSVRTAAGVEFEYDGHEPCGKDYVELLEGGTIHDVDVTGCEGGVQSDTDTGTWHLEGSLLHIAFPGEAERTVRVDRLDDSTMRVKFNQTSGEVTVAMTQEYTRQ